MTSQEDMKAPELTEAEAIEMWLHTDIVQFVVDEKRYDLFVSALKDDQLTNKPRLRKLLERRPAWEIAKVVPARNGRH